MNTKTIIFISEMRNPFANATSTQIMTKNLLEGFKDNCNNLIFVLILENMDEGDVIIDYYEKLCDIIVPYKDITNNRNKRILGKFSMIVNTFLKKKYYIPSELKEYLNDDTVMISHSPSIDSILISRHIKKRYPKINYIQYWSDPITLSLITPETVPYKRQILKIIEDKLHECADKIVYGTESLYNAQMKLDSKFFEKSYYSRVSYNNNNNDNNENRSNDCVFGYYGNYYSSIRDIKPLYDAFKYYQSEKLIICGEGDLNLISYKNIEVLNRVPISSVSQYENKCDVIICILNKVGIQIPGKIFYQINSNKPIIVILDGPYKKEIRNELQKASRFIFAENEMKSISSAIDEAILELNLKKTYDIKKYSPEAVCAEILHCGE